MSPDPNEKSCLLQGIHKIEAEEIEQQGILKNANQFIVRKTLKQPKISEKSKRQIDSDSSSTNSDSSSTDSDSSSEELDFIIEDHEKDQKDDTLAKTAFSKNCKSNLGGLVRQTEFLI